MTVLEYFERRQAMKNGEGYSDPTAGKAIANVSKLPRHIKVAKRYLPGFEYSGKNPWIGDNGAERY